MKGRPAWPMILVSALLFCWMGLASQAAQPPPAAETPASPTASGLQAVSPETKTTPNPSGRERPLATTGIMAKHTRRAQPQVLAPADAGSRPRDPGRPAVVAVHPPRSPALPRPLPRANAPPQKPAAAPRVDRQVQRTASTAMTTGSASIPSPRQPAATPPGDGRVRLATSNVMTTGPVMIPPAQPPQQPATPAAEPGGRKLIVRAVDPNQANVSSMPPGTESMIKLKAAPLEAEDFKFPINLATALRLSDARPLIVAAAQASVWVAEAQLQRARVIWVPSIMNAWDYVRHDGGGPDFNKGYMTAPSVNFFYGGGGLYEYFSLSDALFQPLAARQVLNSRHWDIQTAKNDALQQVADAYFRVHQYRGMYAGTLYCVERGHDLVERIAQLSRDLVPQVEVDRARNMVADLEQAAVSARQEWRVSSADLTQILRLDPRSVVVPLEHDHLQVTLIEPDRTLEDLQSVALSNRPEIAAHRALVQAAVARVRREKMRPALPYFMLNGFQSARMYIEAGIFGLGPNSSMNQWFGRFDISPQVMWQLEGFGLGNLARIKEQRGEESQAIVELYRTQDKVAAEVTAARARLQSAALRVIQADRALRTGIITFNGNYEGLGQTTRFGDVLVLVYRPQEAVYSLELLNVAFNEYFTTVAEYNRAQFELFHALGYPAQEVTLEHPPGNVQEVDTARPNYLPPVGNGPPPATR